jgi:hypothetical protein
MLAWKPPPIAVLCWPVTVVVGVRTAAGVFLAVDRAAVDPGRQIAPNVFADADERTKLVVSPAGVAVALAGCAGTGDVDEAGDLVAAVRSPASAAVTPTWYLSTGTRWSSARGDRTRTGAPRPSTGRRSPTLSAARLARRPHPQRPRRRPHRLAIVPPEAGKTGVVDVTLLIIDECPNHAEAEARVRQALRQAPQHYSRPRRLRRELTCDRGLTPSQVDRLPWLFRVAARAEERGAARSRWAES